MIQHRSPRLRQHRELLASAGSLDLLIGFLEYHVQRCRVRSTYGSVPHTRLYSAPVCSR